MEPTVQGLFLELKNLPSGMASSAPPAPSPFLLLLCWQLHPEERTKDNGEKDWVVGKGPSSKLNNGSSSSGSQAAGSSKWFPALLWAGVRAAPLGFSYPRHSLLRVVASFGASAL